MAYSQTQLDALQAALATGALVVEYEGKKVTYRSLAELKEQISIVQGALDRATGTVKRRAVRIFTSGKGL